MHSYLVDTSIWVDFFRGKSEAVKTRIVELIADNRVYYNGIILSEILAGARSQKQFKFISENFSGLHYLEMDKNFFIATSKIINQTRQKGFTLPVTDIMIASHAKLNGLVVFTKDKHFELIGRAIGFQYDIIENI